MQKVLIWDLPIRVFHWAFAFSVGAALGIAVLAGEESPFFPAHMLFGVAAVFFLVVRIALGIVGNKHNRFPAMLFSPAETIRYIVGAVTGKAQRYPVHNPGSSMAAIGMFILAPLLLATGMGLFGEDEIHGALALLILGLIIAHTAGLALHTWRYKEDIGISMLTGRKIAPRQEELQSAGTVGGAAVLLASAACAGVLFTGYNAASQTVNLPLFGSFALPGEGAEGSEGAEEGEQEGVQGNVQNGQQNLQQSGSQNMPGSNDSDGDNDGSRAGDDDDDD